MKKWSAAFLIAAFAISVSGCGAAPEAAEAEPSAAAAVETNTPDTPGRQDTPVTEDHAAEATGSGAGEEERPPSDSETARAYEEYRIRCAYQYQLDLGFSNGYAWTEYDDGDNRQCMCIIDENGALIFTARLDDLRNLMGKGDFHNIVFQDGVSCLYTTGSYMIFDTDGTILDCKTGTDTVSYHMLGYGYEEFLIWKEVTDIKGNASDYIYAVDMHGNVVREPYPADGGSMSNQHFTCLDKGVFTDGHYFCDLNERIWKNVYFKYDLDHWIKTAVCSCEKCWIFDNYPMARVFAYYDDERGYHLQDRVYGIIDTDLKHRRHCVIYNMDGKIIADINDEFLDMKIERFGLYSGGYIPVMLKDGDNRTYVTVLDSNGNSPFHPISPNLLRLYPQSCYNGYFAVDGNLRNDHIKIITPDGEVKYAGDDVSGLGNEAYMYAEAGSFLSGGFFFEMNSLNGKVNLLYSSAGENMKNMYVSLDGTKIIDTVAVTDRTKTLDQLDGTPGAESMTNKLAESFSRPSDAFDMDLAKIAAFMSEESENNRSNAIEALYKMYGVENIEAYHYGEGMLGGGASAIGTMKLDIDGTDTDILVITCRGSVTPGEFTGDLLKGWIGEKTDPFLGQNVWHNNYAFEEKVWSGLNGYLDKYPAIRNSRNLKIFINGHSLGGAAANMTGARIDSEIASETLFNPAVSREDVYVYTFGAIKVLDSDTNASSGYDNLHNIYNYYDTFGFRGNYSWTNASSANAKFGHTELFALDIEPNLISTENHWMSTYRDALEIEEIYEGFISGCG